MYKAFGWRLNLNATSKPPLMTATALNCPLLFNTCIYKNYSKTRHILLRDLQHRNKYFFRSSSSIFLDRLPRICLRAPDEDSLLLLFFRRWGRIHITVISLKMVVFVCPSTLNDITETKRWQNKEALDEWKHRGEAKSCSCNRCDKYGAHFLSGRGG